MKEFDNILYGIPFIDIIPKNTSSNNKIRIGHPKNPCSAVIIDNLNFGRNRYDSAYIITCDNYKKDGHTENFSSDFEKRYNIKPLIIDIELNNIANIISDIEKNDNIFLKIDLCNDDIYYILELLDSKKYIQIVCTELPIPKNNYQINVFLKYNGLEITQKLLNNMDIKSNLNNIQSNHYLFQMTSRFSIDKNNVSNKDDKKPSLRMCTFLKPEFSKYIQMIEIGHSETPQKELEVNMDNVANIVFQNEFEIYPDKFSCYIKEEGRQNKIIVSRMDKTRMGWGQNLKAFTNVQMLPEISNCVFIRKDIMQENRFTPILNSMSPSVNLEINQNTLNNENNNSNDFSYWTPINIKGYNTLLVRDEKEKLISDHFITKLVPKKKKNTKIGIILPNNKSSVKILKTIFNGIKVDNNKKKTSFQEIYYSLENKEQQKIKKIITEILLLNIVKINNKNLVTLSGSDYNLEGKKIQNTNIQIYESITDGDIYLLLTDNIINESVIKKENIKNIKNILNKYNFKNIANKYENYKVMPEIFDFYKQII